MNCLCNKAWASNYLTTESHIAYREEKKRNIHLYSSHTLPCFDYCLSLAMTYSGGTLIVTLIVILVLPAPIVTRSATSTLQSIQ